MSDLNHDFGGDLSLAPDGDLSCASGNTLGQQRVLRRLLTNPGDYIWQLSYGAGLPVMIGQPADAAFTSSLIRSQIFLEEAVARTPSPTVTVQSADSVVSVSLSYASAFDASAQLVTTAVGP
ncbi:hypothetical protein [Acidisoma sp. C75]